MANRVFRIVAFADLLQQSAIWIRNISLLFYVMEQTDSDPVAVSLLTVMEYAPIFLFSFIGGTFADRWNPKRTMITGDLLSALSIGAILLFVLAGSWQAVFAATVVSAIVSQFSQPSSAVMFKRHVPAELLAPAIGISQGIMSLFIIVGPVIGTLIYSSLGLTYSLSAMIVIFLTAAFVQLSLPPSSRSPERSAAPILEDMKEGFRYIRSQRNLIVIALTFACIGLGSGLIQPLDIYIVTERLQLDKESIQWFYALSGVGMLIGGLAAAALGPKMNPPSSSQASLSCHSPSSSRLYPSGCI
ncbi:MFS transporter [Paenibacillus pabuli]|uniref:MFS transporter n=1 Tax=Paenibacillus pabuli TaxID=1472 RepID=UPI000AE78F5E|nr:MFS transporter [Paenibacillus pabuli]MEC0128210.1 MFS transporter [Paenibacillus pabuli]